MSTWTRVFHLDMLIELPFIYDSFISFEYELKSKSAKQEK